MISVSVAVRSLVKTRVHISNGNRGFVSAMGSGGLETANAFMCLCLVGIPLYREQHCWRVVISSLSTSTKLSFVFKWLQPEIIFAW